jgi:hypothetical protein
MLILSKQMNKDLFYPKALSLHWLRSVAGNVSDYPKYIHTHTATLDTKLLFYAKHFLPCDAYFLVELLHGEGLHKC